MCDFGWAGGGLAGDRGQGRQQACKPGKEMAGTMDGFHGYLIHPDFLSVVARFHENSFTWLAQPARFSSIL